MNPTIDDRPPRAVYPRVRIFAADDGQPLYEMTFAISPGVPADGDVSAPSPVTPEIIDQYPLLWQQFQASRATRKAGGK